MLKILNTASDANLAGRMAEDLRKAGYEVSLAGTTAPVRGDAVIFVLSPAGQADSALQNALVAALDHSLHIVAVMAQPVAVPHFIDHLDVADFSGSYDFGTLKAQVDHEFGPDAPRPMRVLTPTVRKSNRSVGIVLAVAVLVMFLAGLYGVGVLHIQAPINEFNSEATMEAATVMKMIAPLMATYAVGFPKSTEDAANYPATLAAVPTVYRPLVAATATALVATPIPPTKDPNSEFPF
jgi:hypothetical protein